MFVALLLTLSASSQTLNSPESVEYNDASGEWFISNRAAHTILRRSPSGTLSTFASGLTTGPHGMEIVGNRMFVCDGGTLREYNISTGANVQNVNLGASFLNGITHDNNGNLYITDFTAKNIYRFNMNSGAYNIFVGSLVKSPNGIIFDEDDDRLVFVNWGSSAPIMAIAMADSSLSTLTTTSLGNIDGIAMDCQGNFYVASWSPNRITMFDNSFTGAGTNMGYTGLSSPADIYFAQATDSLGVPNSGNNTVTFYSINSCLAPNAIEEQNPAAMLLYIPGTDGEIRLEFSGFEQNKFVEIMDISGKQVFAQQTQSPSMNTKLHEGIFIVRVNDGIHSVTKKIVNLR